mgnify:CR=1 FL=1
MKNEFLNLQLIKLIILNYIIGEMIASQISFGLH